MKKYLPLLMLMITIIYVTGCASAQDPNGKFEIGPAYDSLLLGEYATLDTMMVESETIVEVVKTDKVEDLIDQNVDLTLTEVKVINVLKGDSSLIKQHIRILDLRQTSMGLYDKEDHYVLFLYPKTGRLGDDIYSIVGEYQGKFKVDSNNRLYYDADQYGGYKTFQDELSNLSLKLATNKIHSLSE
ncbi:hypothetical protein [Paenibacillus endoradicis]|uniref:hypothetical protein n=1 Tax=Paenibacillus endoradicis TaxID=2972487 RepID=UPI002159AD9D|nr:hypothetical protein [Paenibacillus endoradicis]MCR8656561.1 hypothetical protein [Paenibacillus endoradicis]